MKSKFLAVVTALAATSLAVAQDDGGDDLLGDLGGALGGLGFIGVAIVGVILWLFFFRGGSSD